MKIIVPPARILLVPTDFSEVSARALSLALTLAPRLDAEVVLAHISQVPIYAYPSGGLVPMMELQEGFSREAERSLEELASQAGGLRAVRCEGEPARCILAIIDDLRPVMVIMGTHGRQGLARLLLGSVAERVLRRSPSPVLIVRSQDE